MRPIISFSSLIILQLSCTTLDVPVCRELKSKITVTKDAFGIPTTTIRANPKCAKAIGEASCGYCTWTNSDKDQWVGENKKTWLYDEPWSKIKDEGTIAPSQSMAKLKAAINTQCRDDNGPTGGMCGDAGKWRVKLDSLDSIGEAVSQP